MVKITVTINEKLFVKWGKSNVSTNTVVHLIFYKSSWLKNQVKIKITLPQFLFAQNGDEKPTLWSCW